MEETKLQMVGLCMWKIPETMDRLLVLAREFRFS